MIVNVSPETEKQLAELAAQNGQPVADFAGALLEETLRAQPLQSGANGSDDEDPDALARAVAKVLNRTPEEREQARARLLQSSRPPRPLPEGQTLFDVVCGKWPGDETDEQVLEALRKLS